jgi:C-terminal processing protease CtpA/Prc
MKKRRWSGLKTWGMRGSLIGVVMAGITACDPVPRRTLSTEEKVADLYWIYSQFGENYAPLELKQKLHGIDYEKLKAQYVEAAASTKSNDEFYQLMMRFVAEFKDAHTSAALTNASLPNRAQTAFLGFSGIRHGDVLLVRKLLPTIAKDSPYPIRVGDQVSRIDGVGLREAIQRDLVPLRDLGNPEANITFHMNKLFTRVSTVNGLPTKTDAVLTVIRDDKEFEVTLPWVTRDLVQFQAEQEKATEDSKKAENFLMVTDDPGRSTLFKFNFVGFDGRIEMPFLQLKKVASGIRKRFADGFRFIDNFSSWELASSADSGEGSGGSAEAKTPMESLRERRSVPAGAVYLDGSKTWPSFVVPRKVKSANGKETGEKKLVGYILVDTFSPGVAEEDAIEEFKGTLSSMQALGVQHLVIDTINNGGGSLTLGMKMAQLLSPKRIEMPKIQFRLSDSWLDQFEKESLNGSSDSEREYSRRILAELLTQKQGGARLSVPYSGEVLAPFAVRENKDLEQPFQVVLLVNEMCASMCDIFAGILQDNKMAVVVGSRTMGAGGNVVSYNQTPNSHLDLRQTESLIVRKSPESDTALSYIENFGITPEIEVPTSSMGKTKYQEALARGFEQVLKQGANGS